jgi:peptide/nickel transport system permease protein
VIRAKLGLDKPVHIQYLLWVRNTLQGDLGQSIYGSHQPVSQLIIEAVPRTLSLSALAFTIAFVLGLVAGIISAVKKYSAMDHTFTFVAFLGISMPGFWLGIMLIIFFSVNLNWLPAIGYKPISDGLWEWFSHLILPSLAIGLPFSAIIARITRSSMLEVLQQDYIQVAHAKGLRETFVIGRHAFPNALIPIVTVTGTTLALVITSAVVIENVFAIKGLGRVLITSIINRDYPIVQGSVIVVSVLFVFTNLAVDILYTMIDPRIRYEA